ncbi:MAG: hypothetical protein RDV48_23140 [Candidatus Eremiobacteraeota bacterium]|nr:hypothetical protein [Candidatus Eremiobacteraeota bacterium]
MNNQELIEVRDHDEAEQKIQQHFEMSMEIFRRLWEEASRDGKLPSPNPLEGVENDIRLASVLNSCSKNSFHE